MRWGLGEIRVVGCTSLLNDHGLCFLLALRIKKKSPAGLVWGLEMPGCWDNKSKWLYLRHSSPLMVQIFLTAQALLLTEQSL